jgi:ornithine cyclodeaminase
VSVLILREAEIRRLIGPAEALAAVGEAFAKLGRGEAILPGVINLDVPEQRGEVHVKGAYLRGVSHFAIKVASGFYANPERGLPMSGGLMLAFDATTGLPAAVLFDNAFLTELRTGSAGALAAELLARRTIRRVGILGAGSQARFQLESLLLVRRPEEVAVWGRTAPRAEACARELRERFGVAVRAVSSPREAVVGSELVVTVTPSRGPLVEADWVGPGTHVTAVGSDGPDKLELQPALLAKADKVVADSLAQCLRLGELHHAVAAGLLKPDSVHAELGEIAAGLKPGRTSEGEITIADLTGLGVQDTAVASFVVAEARRRGLGQVLEL